MPLIPYSPPFIAWAGNYFNLEQALSTPSLAINTSSLTVSSINGLPPGGGGSAISSFSFASISSLNVSSINGLPPGGGGSAISSFSFASISSLNVSSINGHPPSLGAGIFHNVVGSAIQTIPVDKLVSSSVCSAIYVHPSGGGGGQYLKYLTPGTNQLRTEWMAVSGVNETIVWQVLKY
jgi:hypothetical protein